MKVTIMHLPYAMYTEIDAWNTTNLKNSKRIAKVSNPKGETWKMLQENISRIPKCIRCIKQPNKLYATPSLFPVTSNGKL
jgi:hypothetical protein